MKFPKPLVAARGLEHLAMLLSIAGLAAASGMAWRTLDGPGHPSAWNDDACLAGLPSRHVHPHRLTAVATESDRPEFVVSDWVQPGEEGLEIAVAEARKPDRSQEVSASNSNPRLPDQLPIFPVSVIREPRRVRVGDDQGRATVAKVYGGPESRAVILPDGRLGWPNGMVYTDEPFRPLKPDQLAAQLQDGEYRHFQLHQSEHYLIFHTCSLAFAEQSGKLLESLYRGLIRELGERGLDVHEAEFPLVAVIFRNETEFREYKNVSHDIQAYYEVLSNRIFFYETRDRELESPDEAAVRKPQTVAHEGTHQVLQNIGVQPRLARWPIWLIEGLAEFCAPSCTVRGEWAGFGKLNPFHLATIKDLEDPMAIQGRNSRLIRNRIARTLGHSTMQYLLSREELSPTDYSLSWAFTHFLATKRYDDFIAYLKTMSRMPPLLVQTRESQVQAFQQAFGEDLQEIGKDLHLYTNGLKRLDTLPYYALTFEQALGDGLIRRGTIVSQSPMILRQWLEQMSEGFDAPYVCKPYLFASRAAAFQSAEQWIKGR